MKKSDETGLIILALVVGIPMFLLMEHPLIFWWVFVPFVVAVAIHIINWLKK